MRRLSIAVVLALGLSACSVPDWSVAITVDAPIALADQAVQIRLDGVPRGKKVTLIATAVDYTGATWRSQVEAGSGSARQLAARLALPQGRAAPLNRTLVDQDGGPFGGRVE